MLVAFYLTEVHGITLISLSHKATLRPMKTEI